MTHTSKHRVWSPKHMQERQGTVSVKPNSRKGLSIQDARTLWGWAQEYGINGHGPMSNHGKYWQDLHIKIKNIHIPIFSD